MKTNSGGPKSKLPTLEEINEKLKNSSIIPECTCGGRIEIVSKDEHVFCCVVCGYQEPILIEKE